MAKKTIIKNAEGLNEIKVTEQVSVGIIRFLRGRKYSVSDEMLAELGAKAVPAD
ncbi:hypothetical protein HBA93_19925, partial [Ochrobactrum sp. SFR4]|nr:hypothetical protein [Ochrobactrum sp. SFR4]